MIIYCDSGGLKEDQYGLENWFEFMVSPCYEFGFGSDHFYFDTLH